MKLLQELLSKVQTLHVTLGVSTCYSTDAFATESHRFPRRAFCQSEKGCDCFTAMRTEIGVTCSSLSHGGQFGLDGGNAK